MTVYNAQGEKVGSVHDILLDKDGKATGVVLSVGGLLGVGAKSVGLTWKEIDVNPAQQQVQISYTKDQLEAAPDFKTTEQINSEINAQQPSWPPAPSAPAPGGASQSQPRRASIKEAAVLQGRRLALLRDAERNPGKPRIQGSRGARGMPIC